MKLFWPALALVAACCAAAVLGRFMAEPSPICRAAGRGSIVHILNCPAAAP